MYSVRKHGNAPFRVATIHGGPGAPGSVRHLAQELSTKRGVLEPIQTSFTVDGQIDELLRAIFHEAAPPITLIGWSWGAMLSFIFAARHPDMVGKLILIGGGPFEERFASSVLPTRRDRLSEADRQEVETHMQNMKNSTALDKDFSLRRFGELLTKADDFDPLTLDFGPSDRKPSDNQFDIHRSVWDEAKILRASGDLLELGKQIECPVIAIHGDYDSHPVEGVRDSLGSVVKDFKFFLLKDCGHRPWVERAAKDQFYEIIENEIRN